MQAISIFPDDDVEKRKEIIQAIKKVDQKGVIVLTDMPGGTPQT